MNTRRMFSTLLRTGFVAALFTATFVSVHAQTLEYGMTGSKVKQWQLFLIKQGYMQPPALGTFSERTRQATIQFQKSHGLQGLGMVGEKTLVIARNLGFSSGRSFLSKQATPSTPQNDNDPEFSIPHPKSTANGNSNSFYTDSLYDFMDNDKNVVQLARYH